MLLLLESVFLNHPLWDMTFSNLIREFLLMQECNLLKLLHMNAHESKHIDSVND